MVKRLLKHKWYIIAVLALIIIEPMIASWLILWLQNIYNSVGENTTVLEILHLLLFGVLFWFARRLIIYSIAIVKSRFICNIKQDLKRDLFTNALGMNTANIKQIASSGEYISAFTNDVTIIEQRYFSNVIALVSQLTSIVIMGTTFFTMNLKLALFMFGFGIIVVFVPPIFSKKLNRANFTYSKNISNFTQKLKEFLQAYPTIKNYSIEDKILKKFEESNECVEDSKFAYDSSLALADAMGSLLTWFTRIILIGVGLCMVANGEVLLGTVIAALTFSEELGGPLQGLIENINSIKSVKSIINKINDLTTNIEEEAPTKKINTFAENNELTASIKDLTIQFGDKKIVDGFTFEFKPKGKYLIVGKNGAGKSSIFKAIKKRFKNYTGEITFNNVDIKKMSSEELTSCVSYLNENVSIFSGSIKENITLWENVPDTKYNEAVQKAHVELSDERVVGEDGFNISSGEQRRIEIARSLISPARIIIFDEVVSTLDIETAFSIEKMALSFEDKTVVFISHNFSAKLIREYDEILVMKDGRLIAHGSFDQLLKENEYFRNICEIKFGDVR